jgi:hypothetical protein
LELDADKLILPSIPLEYGDAILVPSLPGFVAAVGSVNNDNEFILVEEFYRKPDNGGFYSVGLMILNTMHIGKVKSEVSAER